MRSLPAVLLVLLIATPAAAQAVIPYGVNDAERLRLENQLALQRSQDRQRTMAAEREAFARDQRAQTARTVRALQAPAPSSAALDARIAADSDAIARRQAKALAESNARILAIRPASE